MIWDINIQDAKVNGLVNVFREVDIDGRALSATGQGLIVYL